LLLRESDAAGSDGYGCDENLDCGVHSNTLISELMSIGWPGFLTGSSLLFA
jgi:hypothetical protein